MNRETFQVVLALSRKLLFLVVFASVGNGDGFAQSIETFDVPNANATNPTGINAEGQIIGVYQDASGQQGFLRQADGTITAIDDDPSDPNHPHFCGDQPCGAYLYPQAINATGQITGRYELVLGIDGYTYGFLRQPDGTIVRFFASPESPTK